MSRETKKFKTSGENEVELKTYLTGGKSEIQNITRNF